MYERRTLQKGRPKRQNERPQLQKKRSKLQNEFESRKGEEIETCKEVFLHCFTTSCSATSTSLDHCLQFLLICELSSALEEEVRRTISKHVKHYEDLMTKKKRKLKWYGHVTRSQ